METEIFSGILMRLFQRTDQQLTDKETSEPDTGQASSANVALFARLIEDHRDKLYRVAFRMTGHRQDAEDLLQDALIEAYRAFKRFQPGTHFDRWLYRIMTNTYIDRQRHLKRTGPTESLDQRRDDLGEGTAQRDIPDLENEPSRIVLDDLFGEPVQRALDTLLPEFKMVLILSDIEGLSYDEIAEMMGTPVGTVRSRLHRARGQVRHILVTERKSFD